MLWPSRITKNLYWPHDVRNIVLSLDSESRDMCVQLTSPLEVWPHPSSSRKKSSTQHSKELGEDRVVLVANLDHGSVDAWWQATLHLNLLFEVILLSVSTGCPNCHHTYAAAYWQAWSLWAPSSSQLSDWVAHANTWIGYPFPYTVTLWSWFQTWWWSPCP